MAAMFVTGSWSAPARAADPVRVSTYSGSGAAGFSDGAAASATFLTPMALASDRAGNVYVADAAAQRIRIVATDGSVRTLAGSGDAQAGALQVAGGYRDGPAASARFNDPIGLAVSLDGSTVYVADALNHCIRTIHGGTVRTLAGKPGTVGHADGAVNGATFSFPRSLALAKDGTLYVSDLIDGIRTIANGTVATLALEPHPGRRYAGIALWDGPPKRTIFIGTIDSAKPASLPFITAPSLSGGLLAVDATGATVFDTARDGVEADATVGFPTDIVALGPDDALFTDARRSTVRYSSYTYSTWVAAHPYDDAELYGAGYRDGDGAQAQFHAPTGIALLPDGSAIVADAGNRLLRRISGFDTRREIADQTMLEPLSQANNCYRIAVVSNSGAFFNTLWHDSAPGLLETRLNAGRPKNGLKRPACVFAVRLLASTLESIDSFTEEYLGAGLTDAVVLEVNLPLLSHETHGAKIWLPLDDGDAWHAQPVATLKKMRAALASDHVSLFAVSVPFGSELSESDSLWTRLVSLDESFATAEPYARDATQLNAMLAQSGIPYVDAYPVFLDLERAAHSPALYGTLDVHPGPEGNAIVAGLLGDQLERSAPWSHAP